MKPLAIDLFCGLGGWTEGLLAEGYYVVGFDNIRHEYGEHRYPGNLVIQDVLTLHGVQFKDAALIVASPPCQEYSYMAMPWKVAKKRAAEYRSGVRDVRELTRLFDACFRIQSEACKAAGSRHIPMVVENVRGAIPWVGRSRWNYGSYHLWGDVPALMPMAFKTHKVQGFRFDGSKVSFQEASVRESATKNTGGSWFGIAHNKGSGVGRNPDGRNDPRDRDPMWKRGFTATAADRLDDSIKQGGDWFSVKGSISRTTAGNRCPRSHGSKSSKRAAASAMIAKIPTPLGRHIARTYFPT